jgi:TatD DNase family protein
MFIDSHSHWSDPRYTPEIVESLLKKANGLDITSFMLGGIDQADWQRQLDLKSLHPESFHLCFGLHPYFVAKNSNSDCENALDDLVKIIDQATGLGETGLDFRTKILESGGLSLDEGMAHQIDFFENQIELAKVYQKPMILHIVQAHEKALQIFEMWGVPDRTGLVHAFNGSYETAVKYIDLGFMISIGGAVTFDKNQKLHQAISRLPAEFLLVESDSPDQAPQNWTGLNDSSSLWQIAGKIGGLRGITAEAVLEISTGNFKKLFSL